MHRGRNWLISFQDATKTPPGSPRASTFQEFYIELESVEFICDHQLRNQSEAKNHKKWKKIRNGYQKTSIFTWFFASSSFKSWWSQPNSIDSNSMKNFWFIDAPGAPGGVFIDDKSSILCFVCLNLTKAPPSDNYSHYWKKALSLLGWYIN